MIVLQAISLWNWTGNLAKGHKQVNNLILSRQVKMYFRPGTLRVIHIIRGSSAQVKRSVVLKLKLRDINIFLFLLSIMHIVQIRSLASPSLMKFIAFLFNFTEICSCVQLSQC